MAVEGTKIREMMEGKTLEKDNIKKMYDMVQNASEPEDKKKVMKHSVFFIGQLPLKENHIVDLEQTRRIVNGSVPFSEDGNKILSFRSVRGGSGLLYECGGISRVPHGIL